LRTVSKILLFHGYLLRGTGSNVYTAQLAQALARLGHEVHVLSQERRPDGLPWVDAAGDWDTGELRVRRLHDSVQITAYRPDIGRVLPVYVHDRYEGFDARTFLECTDAEVEAYVARNVAAVREVAERVRPDVALAGHLVMGPAIVRRALGGLGVPYAVKIHGSALEYVVKRDPERFGPWAREGLEAARGVLVGSRHTAESLWEAMGDPDLPARTRLGPPGVDVREFAPRSAEEAARGVRALAAALRAAGPEHHPPGSALERDLGAAADALDRLRPGRDRLVAYVGKLIVSKGVDLLAAAWPLVLAAEPRARLVVVGFGAYREGFERLVAALSAGDRDAALALADAGREVEGGPRAPLRHLRDVLSGAGDDYWRAAAGLADRVVVVGRLEHAELAELLPACEAQVVPSTFPEAFGMVAAEAAACGVLPVSAGHSGLREVSAQLASALPAPVRPWLSFPLDDDPVRGLAERVVAWLRAPGDVRAAARDALVGVARERFSWEGVANGVLAAARGDLTGLAQPSPL
jgi:glycosyltransferase involved in cell wall biosynthesis